MEGRRTRGRGRQGEDAEEVVVRLEVADDLDVSMVAGRLVGFVCKINLSSAHETERKRRAQ